MLAKSEGHIEVVGKYEYFLRTVDNGDNLLFQAHIDRPVMPDGFRCGRWVTVARQADSYLQNLKEMMKNSL
ncbi:MAG: hypothetical protein GY743_23225 [Planctomycetaceae bacterium]|nr:hypothetical protein [Planctomycetaceae bacterium]